MTTTEVSKSVLSQVSMTHCTQDRHDWFMMMLTAAGGLTAYLHHLHTASQAVEQRPDNIR